MSASLGCTTLPVPPHRAHDAMSLACMPDQWPAAAASEKRRHESPKATRLTTPTLAATFVAMLAVAADASARWFTVEIVVFDDLQGEGLHAEHWPADPGEPSPEGAFELTSPPKAEPGGDAHAFRLVDRSELSMNGVWSSLRRSARYRPLLHAGWRLPGIDRSAARPAYVSAHPGSSGTRAAGRDSGELPAVRGTVKVSLARYLHVEIDLLYHRPGNSVTAAPDAVPTRFRLVSERRMRSEELHYIDHPLFGVLVLITPLQATPESAPEA